VQKRTPRDDVHNTEMGVKIEIMYNKKRIKKTRLDFPSKCYSTCPTFYYLLL
jgi:hypothetical protein